LEPLEKVARKNRVVIRTAGTMQSPENKPQPQKTPKRTFPGWGSGANGGEKGIKNSCNEPCQNLLDTSLQKMGGKGKRIQGDKKQAVHKIVVMVREGGKWNRA